MFLGSWSVLEGGMRDVGNENAYGKSGTSIYIYINQYIQIKDLYNRILYYPLVKSMDHLGPGELWGK